MRKSKLRSLNECLDGDQTLVRLTAHAGHVHKLQQLFARAVPAMLRASCRVVNYKAGVVVVHAENGAVASKLRQLAPTLGGVFSSGGEQVTEIRIRVQPGLMNAAPRKVRTPARLGEAGRNSLQRLADSLPDGPLRMALGTLIERSLPRR